MKVTAFEGPAGTGKTHRLMEELLLTVKRRNLCSHERILALTFMHGARRRLDSRLRLIEEIQGQFLAMTLDSFAWRLCNRWQQLASSLDYDIPSEREFDDTCQLAANLLKRPVVASWTSVSFPLIIVDEAQDLSAERSMMIQMLAPHCRVLLAFDEFQCLNNELRPMPIGSWLPQVSDPTKLEKCWRTEDAELLQAAHSVRNGDAVKLNGRKFKVEVTPGKPYAATYLANFIAWRGGGNVAVLTPSRRGGFSNSVVDLVCKGPLGKRKSGPFSIRWENTDTSLCDSICEDIAMPNVCSVPDALIRLQSFCDSPPVRSARNWIQHQASVTGLDSVTAAAVRIQIERALVLQRQYGDRLQKQNQFTAMTIQQAKNQEFDHVVVIWPYTVPNDDDQKRRLLYNAITRAKKSCLVLVQAQKLASAAPFVS